MRCCSLQWLFCTKAPIECSLNSFEEVFVIFPRKTESGFGFEVECCCCPFFQAAELWSVCIVCHLKSFSFAKTCVHMMKKRGPTEGVLCEIFAHSLNPVPPFFHVNSTEKTIIYLSPVKLVKKLAEPKFTQHLLHFTNLARCLLYMLYRMMQVMSKQSDFTLELFNLDHKHPKIEFRISLVLWNKILIRATITHYFIAKRL